jgi:hypothetical protein
VVRSPSEIANPFAGTTNAIMRDPIPSASEYVVSMQTDIRDTAHRLIDHLPSQARLWPFFLTHNSFLIKGLRGTKKLARGQISAFVRPDTL